MKKILCVLLMLILVLSLVACGGNETPEEGETPGEDSGDSGLPDVPIIPDWDPDGGTQTPIIPI